MVESGMAEKGVIELALMPCKKLVLIDEMGDNINQIHYLVVVFRHAKTLRW